MEDIKQGAGPVVQMPKLPNDAFEFIEKARIANERATGGAIAPRLSDLGAQQAGIEITPTAADPTGLRTKPFTVEATPPMFILQEIAPEAFKFEPAQGIIIDGRAMMSNEQAEAAVNAVLAQSSGGYKFSPLTYEINGVEVPKYLYDIDTERVEQIIWLTKKVSDLEDFQKKVIAAFKHLGLDTNKLFR